MGRVLQGAWVALVGFSLAVACDGSKAPSTKGALDVVLLTDMALPKDLDRVSVRVTQGGHTLLGKESDVGPDALKLPATFQVKATGDSSPVTVRAAGFKSGEVRVERDAVTPIPDGYVGELRLALNYLCVGSVETTSDGSIVSSCPKGETCVNGACKSAIVPPSEVPPVSMGAAADGGGPKEGCFDVAACFGAAKDANVDTSRCVITLPDGTNPAGVNVALKFAAGGTGVCDATACWISLTGWTVDGSEIQLPDAACKDAASQGGTLVISTSCSAEPEPTPVCGDWSSVTAPMSEPMMMSVIAPSCDGPSTQACDRCGTQARTCMNGVHGPWGTCTGQGACEPSATRSCGTGGSQACSDGCEWGPCACPADQLTCGAAGKCASPGEVHTCGSCSNDCTSLPHVAGAVSCNDGQCAFAPSACAAGWGDCNGRANDGCETPLSDANHCGSCTTSCAGSTPICSSTSDSPTGCVAKCTGTLCGTSCVDTTSDASNCGACGTSCSAGSTCTSAVCTCSGPTSQACGNCGTQSRTCSNGTWSAWSMCMGERACAPDGTQPCNGNGAQICGSDCQWGACACKTGYELCGSACVDEQIDSANCGTCGNVCVGGVTCKTGACPCMGPSSQACGNCGTQTRTCNANGSWSAWGTCSGQGACTPNAMTSCEGNGLQTCGSNCQWGGCSCKTGSVLCNNVCVDEQSDSKNCGGCGSFYVCGAGKTCQSGTCQCAPGTQNCGGTCMAQCPTPVATCFDSNTGLTWASTGSGVVTKSAAENICFSYGSTWHLPDFNEIHQWPWVSNGQLQTTPSGGGTCTLSFATKTPDNGDDPGANLDFVWSSALCNGGVHGGTNTCGTNTYCQGDLVTGFVPLISCPSVANAIAICVQ